MTMKEGNFAVESFYSGMVERSLDYFLVALIWNS